LTLIDFCVGVCVGGMLGTLNKNKLVANRG